MCVCVQTLPALVQLVQHEDLGVKIDSCWALSFLADGKEKQMQVYTHTHFLLRMHFVSVIVFCGLIGSFQHMHYKEILRH